VHPCVRVGGTLSALAGPLKAFRLLSQKFRRDLLLMLGVMLLYWLAAKLGFVFALNSNSYLTPVWPPAAVACVAGILYGPASLVGAAAYISYDFVANDSSHG